MSSTRRGRGRGRVRKSTIDRSWTLFLMLLRRLGRRPALSITLFGLVAFVGSTVIGLATDGPKPAVHDEFAYLLAADTFANGRLTNPSPLHWEHFETFHVLVEPTYASKYPPGQGLILAVGQVLTGSPATGVWLSAGLMAAAFTWMLLKWLPPQWAVLAAILGTVQLGWFSYWSHSYWGGAVAATGGALAFGAFRLLTHGPHMTAGVILGIGLSVLAISRPFEGGIAGLCIASALAWPLMLRTRTSTLQGGRLRAPLLAAAVVSVTLGALGYYNWRVTGSVLTMPYQLYQRQYTADPPLLVGAFRDTKPSYRHREVERFFTEWAVERRNQQTALPQVLWIVPFKLVGITIMLLGVGALAVLGLAGIWRHRPLRFVVIATSTVMAATLLSAASYPHYVAPVASLFYVLCGASLADLHRKSRARRGINLSIVVVCVLVLVTPWALARTLSSPQTGFAEERVRIVRQLEEMPAKSLVLVSYAPTHDVLEEWVYNGADLEAEKVVWARSMSREQNQVLINHFSNRMVWHLTPDSNLELKPYP